jgi:uncharacterized protein (DUF2141 family)
MFLESRKVENQTMLLRTPSLWGVFLLLFVAIVSNQCAQVAQPPGGKKDTLAPKLVLSYPKMRATNVKPKQVELYFDEYINAEGFQQKTIITPGTGLTFDTRVKPTGIVLLFNEPLKDSTTYTISFTDGIKDATERNPATNLKLVFSTGPQLDSLNISGTVSNIISGTTVEEALVGLYAPRDTLDAQKTKPIYYSKTDTSGIFQIENVKGGEYDVVAFTDRNNNFTFNPDKEEIGFVKERIKLTKSVSGLNIQLFSQNTIQPRISRTESRSDAYTLNLNKGILNYKARFRNPTDSLPSTMPSPTQIKFFRTKQTADTLSVQILVQDSLGIQSTLKHTINFRQKSKREKPEEFLVRAEPPNNDAVEAAFSWKLTFNKPVKAINKEKIAFSLDSTTNATLASYTSTLGTKDTELTTQIATKAKKFVRVKWQKDAFESILGDTVAITTLTYPILDPEDFGVLRGRVNTTEPTYFVELLDERQTVIRTLHNPVTYEMKNIKPGKYRLRLVIDRNKNGKWDTGRYDQRLEPEPIRYYPSVINVKQNFELEGIDL